MIYLEEGKRDVEGKVSLGLGHTTKLPCFWFRITTDSGLKSSNYQSKRTYFT